MGHPGLSACAGRSEPAFPCPEAFARGRGGSGCGALPARGRKSPVAGRGPWERGMRCAVAGGWGEKPYALGEERSGDGTEPRTLKHCVAAQAKGRRRVALMRCCASGPQPRCGWGAIEIFNPCRGRSTLGDRNPGSLRTPATGFNASGVQGVGRPLRAECRFAWVSRGVAPGFLGLPRRGSGSPRGGTRPTPWWWAG